MKIILTGGHLSPLLSLVDLLKKENEILIVGRKYALEGDRAISLEYREVQNKKVSFISITSGRLQRKFTIYTLYSLLKFPFGFIQSLFIIKEFKPSVVVSFGGYISLPVSIAAFLLKIPLVIHEQTLEAGLANRISSFFAKKICISWESSKKFFSKEKTVLTGNPIRQFKVQTFGFSSASLRAGAWGESSKFKVIEEGLPIIYITGGSLGSHRINVLVEGCIEKLLDKFIVIHQTGDAQKYKDFEKLEKLRKTLDENLKRRYVIKKFLGQNEVAWVFEKADLVVSRSGINTITELLYFAKPSFLVPLPFSQNNEQLKNALFLQKEGLGEVVIDDKLNSERLYKKILLMIKNKDRYLKNKNKIKALIKKDAAEKIKAVIMDVVYDKKQAKN